eukprot:CAMPEP_0178953076 /NCGR_PEP_ID=MMETSP0789-20121207/8212_1 /TAXON_ID=3005 /ORGANISM="Rhizosolenia setigera, Strain CCMP 1694" /LENGTH=336 /DNA_ID=CAMNT_0020634283 /DNA_START=180 /DNA_END=1190 /DNA_ORIENTATION=-
MASIITQISCGFDSLNDDTHGLILEFVGKKSYYAYGATNKRCNQIFLSKEWSKETFLYGYAPLAVIQDKCTRHWMYRLSVGYGVLFYNRRDILEWAFLKQQEHPETLNRIFDTSLEVGRLDFCNELHDRSMKDVLRVDDDIHSLVARDGKLDTLKWLDARSYLDNSKKGTCAISAARGGHLNILEWLNKNGYSFGSLTINEAAGGGHLHVLEWLNENGCSFDSKTISNAAYEGHLHIVEWLRDNNCPWDHYCYEGAANGGHLHVLDWLRDNECPRGNAILELYEEALEDDVNVWLFDNGFSMFHYSDVEYDSEDEYESYYEGGDYHYYGYEEYDSD